jgi:nitrogen fixation protein FixH
MGLVVVVNAVLAWLAIDTFPGLSTEDAYRKGLAYNQTIAAAEASAQRGWRLALTFTPTPQQVGHHSGEVSVAIADRDGRPLDDLDVHLAMVRPAHAGADVHLALGHRGNGRYAGGVILPLAGQWEARIVARRSGETVQHSERVMVP